MKEHSAHAAGYDFPVIEKGEGEAIVFVHGSVCDYRYWRDDVTTLGDQFRAIAMSRRHHWPKATKTKFSYHVEDQTDDVIAFVEALDIGPVHLIGHSYGGYLAAAFACKRPDLLKTLTLVEPGGPVEGKKMPQVMQEGILEAIDIIKQGQVEEGIKHFHRSVTSTPKWEEMPNDLRSQLIENALTLPPQHYNPRPPLSSDALQRFDKPTLIMIGEHTLKPFPEVANQLTELIPQSNLVRIPDAAHPLNRENPKAFTSELLQFLKKSWE
ncbi:alpha/beta fold hydrolase [Ruegeria atlantica]|uniref:alpha/beta fold hydrolase n=1 Tax=Ruegeria atlantica TaxID=81569 RepID=UPI00249515CF|nr:alpha/beta hydrolase [Ruegeria atlantica]